MIVLPSQNKLRAQPPKNRQQKQRRNRPRNQFGQLQRIPPRNQRRNRPKTQKFLTRKLMRMEFLTTRSLRKWTLQGIWNTLQIVSTFSVYSKFLAPSDEEAPGPNSQLVTGKSCNFLANSFQMNSLIRKENLGVKV